MALRRHDWYSEVLTRILAAGREVAPRGYRVKEVLGLSLIVEQPLDNIVVHAVRNLNFRFMVAEWLWIAFGLNDVGILTRYNSQMARFSDDGKTLAGAYGPRLRPQWAHVLSTLNRDPDSRQAVATIWTPSPSASKDIPCTISLQFMIRGGRLHTFASMRSSDAWLGLPYDVFTFSQLGNMLAGELRVEPGPLHLHLASSHLYEMHWDLGKKFQTAEISSDHTRYARSPILPGFPPELLRDALTSPIGPALLRFIDPVWHRYVRALRAPSWREALAHLESREVNIGSVHAA